MDNDFKLKNGSGRLCCGGCGRQNNKLNTYDWLADIPGNADEQDIVEVQFKNCLLYTSPSPRDTR